MSESSRSTQLGWTIVNSWLGQSCVVFNLTCLSTVCTLQSWSLARVVTGLRRVKFTRPAHRVLWSGSRVRYRGDFKGFYSIFVWSWTSLPSCRELNHKSLLLNCCCRNIVLAASVNHQSLCFIIIRFNQQAPCFQKKKQMGYLYPFCILWFNLKDTPLRRSNNIWSKNILRVFSTSWW